MRMFTLALAYAVGPPPPLADMIPLTACKDANNASKRFAGKCPQARTRTFRYVKLFGERHSGTKFLTGELAKAVRNKAAVLTGVNTEAKSMPPDAFFRETFAGNLGWKHAVAPTPDYLLASHGADAPNCNNTLFTVTTRHPLDWASSMQHITYVQGWPARDSINEFVRRKAVAVPRDHRSGGEGLKDEPSRPAPWPNPLRMWADKVESYTKIAKAGCAVFVTRLAQYTNSRQAQSEICALALASFEGEPIGHIHRELWNPTLLEHCLRHPHARPHRHSLSSGSFVASTAQLKRIGPSKHWANNATRTWANTTMALSPDATMLTHYTI
jgi:hypothetical protein